MCIIYIYDYIWIKVDVFIWNILNTIFLTSIISMIPIDDIFITWKKNQVWLSENWLSIPKLRLFLCREHDDSPVIVHVIGVSRLP